jgi:bacterioferritin-associated ferredoxin
MTIKIGLRVGQAIGVVMYVCICRAVTLSRIEALAASGVTTLDAIERACGAGGDCGTCREDIAHVLAEECSSRRPQSEAA